MSGRLPTFGFPRMLQEAGERRDFLPPLLGHLAGLGTTVVAEHGLGSGMGYRDGDYASAHEKVRLGTRRDAFAQDIVVVLRAPVRDLQRLHPGATLVSMLHFPTQRARVLELAALGIEAISLDLVTDDGGRRLVVNGRAVAWNGLDAAFDALELSWPELLRPGRRPVRVTIMGAGEVGKHATEAATKYGSLARAVRFAAAGLTGVEVVTVGRNLTCDARYMRERLPVTDVFVDATRRSDPSVALVPNAWLDLLPTHAIVCDLVVDPYDMDAVPPTVRGIEGIPQGNLDRLTFDVDDPAWDAIPPGVPTQARRRVVSCYSWPGLHPEACMELYGAQLAPLLEALARSGGARGLRDRGPLDERALSRASLRTWLARSQVAVA